MTGVVPLSLMATLHFWTCAGYALKRNYPMAVVFGCYGVSTLGFIWSLYRP